MHKFSHHIKYGLTTALVLISAIVILYISKVSLNDKLQMGILVGLICTGVIASCIQFKKINTTASSNEVFFNGFRTTAIIALIVLAFGVLIINLVPAIKNDLVAKFKEEAIKNQTTNSTVTVEEQVADYKNRFTTMFIGINMMIIVISGLVSSFIGVVLTKNK